MLSTRAKYPPHAETFFQNLEEIDRLLEIHLHIAGNSKGYKHNVEVLNKSAIVLLVACWEAFIEDLLTNAFDFILSNTSSPNSFPNKVLTLASKELKESKDETDIWKLAQDGWKNILRNHRTVILKKHIAIFNTPKAENINDLAEKLIGIKNITQEWHWKGMSAENSAKKLAALIELRGTIAHRVATNKSITKGHVTDHRKFINCLAVISHNRVLGHIQKTTKLKPWSYHYVGNIH